jgi:hypothetical protein
MENVLTRDPSFPPNMFDYIPPNRKSGTTLMQLSVLSSVHRWHHHAFWYCSPLAIKRFRSNLRYISGQFSTKITGFSRKMATILDFCYFVHFYASNSGGISQEYDFIQRIFESI